MNKSVLESQRDWQLPCEPDLLLETGPFSARKKDRRCQDM